MKQRTGSRAEFCFLLLLSFFLSVASSRRTEKEKENGRREKLFIVKIQNTPCQVGSSNGTCYLKGQCADRGGEAVGLCSDGVATCCKFELGCSNTSNYRTIREKDVLLKDNKDCHYEFSKVQDHCQLRIQVSNLYGEPSVNGDCETGSMTIEDSVTVHNFPLCGQPGRPLYASFGQSSRITLSFARGILDTNSNYEVKVTQIRCDARDRVPDHCLVEYGGRAGKVQSLGYDKGWIAGQKYNACVRRAGTTIRWTKCDRSLTHYDTVTPNGPIPSKDFILSKLWGPFGSFGDSCADGTSYVAMLGSRFCGNHFPNLTTSMDEPFFLSVSLKKDDFAKIPSKLLIVPSLDLAGTCASMPLLNTGTLFDTTMCAGVATSAGTDKYLFQCACPKTIPPDPANYDKSILAFNIGFCLEYSQT